MTQEEKWNLRYDEVVVYMKTYHRNPSKHRPEDAMLLNWMKQQRKLMNRGELRPDRMARFKSLQAKGERYKRENQWVEIDPSILNEDTLREYQQNVLENLRREWQKHRSVMVQMPTGTGKTILLAAVIRESLPQPLQREGRTTLGILIVAHRRELIEQISDTLDAFGVEHGIILAGQTEDGTKKVQVASIQTLSRRDNELNPSLVVVDEAHRALAETYRELWERWPEAKFLGLTATPCRLSGEPFTDLFDVLVQSWSVVEFIRKGWLSDVEYVSVRSDSVAIQKVASLNKRGADGDYQTKQMANVLDVPESIEHLYRSYRKYADGKKGIVYAINQQHARHIAEYYQEHGVNCCMIDSNTPSGQRQQWVEDYRQGRIDVLVNVDIFSSGFDCPEVEFIQLARPTLSLALYLQQIGRGMRISEGKSKVTILDQVGLWLVFGLPTTDWNWKDMFEGKVAGKGRLDYNTLGLTRGMGEEKTLVNEEMYRIQTLLSELGDEKKKGGIPEKEKPVTYGPNKLEIFKELGRYGLKRMGEVCLPPIYEQMERLWRSKKYFAMALLPKERSGIRDAWTIINKEGEDINVRMIGEWVSTDDGVFEFRSKKEGRFVTRFYDVENNEIHTSRMERIGGACFFRSNDGDTYILRGDSAYRKNFRRDEVVYNDCLTIVGSDLFVKSDDNRRYRIVGYHGDCVIVEEGTGLTEIKKDGSRGQALEVMPKNATEQPDFQLLELRRQTALSAVLKFGRGFLPRDYQQEMLDAFWNRKRRRKRVLLQVPIGTGKMWMAMAPIREEMMMSNQRNYYKVNKVLIVTHRQELMGQIADTLERCGIKPAIMRKGRFTNIARCDATLTSAAFVQSQLDMVSRFYEPTLIAFDEAHLIPKTVYDKLLERWPDARLIGLTATPVSNDDLTLKKYFNQFVPSWSIKRLVVAGWMKDIDYVDEGLDNRKLGKLAALTGADECGDFDANEVAGILDTSAEVERLYRSYQKHADGRRGIVCAINDQHAQHIAECYQRHGVKAAVCLDLNTQEGKQQVENLRNGNLKVLVEVKQFSDGFRCPEIEFVQLACPTRLLATYLHQVECGMRIERMGTEHNGSALHHDTLIVIDHVGAKEAFGLPTDDRNWNALFEGGKLEKKARKIARKVAVKKTEAKPLAKPSPTFTKWQLRMQRLLGD